MKEKPTEAPKEIDTNLFLTKIGLAEYDFMNENDKDAFIKSDHEDESNLDEQEHLKEQAQQQATIN